MEPRKVLFIDTVHDILWKRLHKYGYQCIDGTSLSETEFKHILADCFGLVIRSRFRVNESFLKMAVELKFVARSGSGLENIDQVYCKKRGIKIISSPEGNAPAVAEHALALILCLFNKIHLGHANMLNGVWDREMHRGLELSSKKVGIIGYGHTGKAFAKVLSGIGCKVYAHDIDASLRSDSYAELVALDELKEKCDVISIHLPLSDETTNYVNKEFIDSVEHPFYLVNTARGAHVEYKALLAGLESRKVLGACMDVHAVEKSSFEKLDVNDDFEKIKQKNNVLLSPHVAGWTVESYERLSSVLADKIEAEFN